MGFFPTAVFRGAVDAGRPHRKKMVGRVE